MGKIAQRAAAASIGLITFVGVLLAFVASRLPDDERNDNAHVCFGGDKDIDKNLYAIRVVGMLLVAWPSTHLMANASSPHLLWVAAFAMASWGCTLKAQKISSAFVGQCAFAYFYMQIEVACASLVQGWESVFLDNGNGMPNT